MEIIEKQNKELKSLRDTGPRTSTNNPSSRQSDNRSDFWKEKNKEFYGASVVEDSKKKGASLSRKATKGQLPPTNANKKA